MAVTSREQFGAKIDAEIAMLLRTTDEWLERQGVRWDEARGTYIDDEGNDMAPEVPERKTRPRPQRITAADRADTQRTIKRGERYLRSMGWVQQEDGNWREP